MSNACPHGVQALRDVPLSAGADALGDALQRHRDAVRARLLRSDQVRPGPDSISWQINREVIVLAGWSRAILLQLAHPSVAAGVHQHSTFRGSLLSSFRRLHSTVGAMLALTFGDTEQMISAAAGIRHSGYGMGACAGDVDNDGRTDVYLTSYGANTLYRNAGGGAFADVTRAAGVGLTGCRRPEDGRARRRPSAAPEGRRRRV